MTVDEQLAIHFPQHQSSEMAADWDAVKQQLQIGAVVAGRVVQSEQFGVFFDIGVGFPALIIVVRFTNADTVPYTSMDMYPALHADVGGRIYVFDDNTRQIGVTQQSREPWMKGNW